MFGSSLAPLPIINNTILGPQGPHLKIKHTQRKCVAQMYLPRHRFYTLFDTKVVKRRGPETQAQIRMWTNAGGRSSVKSQRWWGEMGAWMDGWVNRCSNLVHWLIQSLPLSSINTGSPLYSHCFHCPDTINSYLQVQWLSHTVVPSCFCQAGGET